METGGQQDFYPLMENRFQARRGPAFEKGADYCRIKLCFVATDQEILRKTLLELSLESDCYFVKYDTFPREGMYRGRCFFMTREKVGETWAYYKGHPKLNCSVQDDGFTGTWREQVKNWDDEPVA